MPRESQPRPIILASSSRYRSSLLKRLCVDFDAIAPKIDETALDGEAPSALVTRLARAKAAVIAAQRAEAVVIGSDQVAVRDAAIVGKPGSAAAARAQLRAFSGRRIDFLTAVSVQCAAIRLDFRKTVVTRVYFRDLTESEIRRYVALEQPYDCAGAFKSEAAGIGLLRRIESRDPSALVGLPLIAVAEGLRRAGIRVP